VSRDGKIVTGAVKKIIEDHADAYVGDCPML